MMTKITGKVAIVTGAEQGVSRGIALALASGGARIMLAGRTKAKLDGVRAEIMAAGGVPAYEAARWRSDHQPCFIDRHQLGHQQDRSLFRRQTGDRRDDAGVVVLFLTSEDAAYITGAMIPVDGGQANWR